MVLVNVFDFIFFSTIEVDSFTAKIFDIYETTRTEGLSQVRCVWLIRIYSCTFASFLVQRIYYFVEEGIESMFPLKYVKILKEYDTLYY